MCSPDYLILDRIFINAISKIRALREQSSRTFGLVQHCRLGVPRKFIALQERNCGIRSAIRLCHNP